MKNKKILILSLIIIAALAYLVFIINQPIQLKPDSQIDAPLSSFDRYSIMATQYLFLAFVIVFLSFISKTISEHLNGSRFEGRYYIYSFLVYAITIALGNEYLDLFYTHSFFGNGLLDILFVGLLLMITVSFTSYILKCIIAKNRPAFVLADVITAFVSFTVLVWFAWSFGESMKYMG